MFYKFSILLFSSLLNVITASVGRSVGGRSVGGLVGKYLVFGCSVVCGSVVGGFNKTHHLYQEKEIIKKLYNNIMNSIKLQNKMNTILTIL